MSREEESSGESASNNVEYCFENFCQSNSLVEALRTFHQLVYVTGADINLYSQAFFIDLKTKLLQCANKSKNKKFFDQLTEKTFLDDYKQENCRDLKVLVVGCGPVGLRAAIEYSFLGCKVLIVEKRKTFSRSNIVHLWPFLIHDLKSLGIKKFVTKFCLGDIDIISIKTLELSLLKVALLYGVKVYSGYGFKNLIYPCHRFKSHHPLNSDCWRAEFEPKNDVLSSWSFNVIVGADGKRSSLHLPTKMLRAKLAIAITVSFVNKKTPEEATIPNISGIISYSRPAFFKQLKEQLHITLENLVYYNDETHFFIMTAKKDNLLKRNIIKKDYEDTKSLLERSNVNMEALQEYARSVALFSTNNALANNEFNKNAKGEPDVNMFDFTEMNCAEYAARVLCHNDKVLLQTLVGDALIEPFWPTGSGLGRGFLSAFDSAWLVSEFANGHPIEELLAKRHSVFQHFTKVKSDDIVPFDQRLFSLIPSSRYTCVNMNAVSPSDVSHMIKSDDSSRIALLDHQYQDSRLSVQDENDNLTKLDLILWSNTLLCWYLNEVRCFMATDFNDEQWNNGKRIAAMMHCMNPEDEVLKAKMMNFITDSVRNEEQIFKELVRWLKNPSFMSNDLENEWFQLILKIYIKCSRDTQNFEVPFKVKIPESTKLSKRKTFCRTRMNECVYDSVKNNTGQQTFRNGPNYEEFHTYNHHSTSFNRPNTCRPKSVINLYTKTGSPHQTSNTNLRLRNPNQLDPKQLNMLSDKFRGSCDNNLQNQTLDDSMFKQGMVRRRRAELIAKMNKPKPPVEVPQKHYNSPQSLPYQNSCERMPDLCYSMINFNDQQANSSLNFLNQSNEFRNHMTGSMCAMKPSGYSDNSTLQMNKSQIQIYPLYVSNEMDNSGSKTSRENPIYGSINSSSSNTIMSKSCNLSLNGNSSKAPIKRSVNPQLSLKKSSEKLIKPLFLRNICFICSNPVKSFERITYNGMIFHKQCLRCNICDMPLRQNEVRIFKDDCGKMQFLCDLHYKYLTDPIISNTEARNATEIKSKTAKNHVTSPFLNKRHIYTQETRV